MLVDYTPAGDYLLKVTAADQMDMQALMVERGLDYSRPDSVGGTSVFYTKEPWGLADLWEHGTEAAKRELAPIGQRIALSQAPTSGCHFKVPYGKELFDFQKASLEYALSRNTSLIADQPGLGKPNPVSEPVLTPSGWRTMGELRVGDEVISVDGKPTKVLAVFPQGVQPVWEVTFRDGTVSRCGEEHLWTVGKEIWARRGRGEWRAKTLRELMDSGLCLPQSGNRVGAKYYIPLVAPVQHDAIDAPIDPYTLGVLLGDGSLNGGSVSFSTPDIDMEIAERVRAALPEGYSLSENRQASCPRYYLVGGSGENHFRRWVKRLGINVLSTDKRIPKQYMFASVSQRIDLLRGLMDTDGSAAERNRICFHSKSLGLSQDVAELVRSLGGMAILRTYDRTKEGKGVEYQVNVKMPECPFYLKRKADRWRPVVLRRYIRSAKQVGHEEQVCISVENPSHLYVTANHIVTHNTPMAITYANEIGAKRVLVICPAALRHQWARRIREWSTMEGKYIVYPVLNARNGIHPAAEWTVISYALARNPALVAAFSKLSYDLVIIDESHFLKESDSAQTKAIYGQADGKYHWKRGHEPLPSIVSRCAHVLCLSGTPIVNRPLEAYTTSRALCWDAIDYLSLDRFRERFNPQKQVMMSGGKRFTDEKIGRVKELGNRMRGMYMARHAKRDVMTQLKMPKYEVVQMEETGEIKAALKSESLLGIDVDALQTTNDYQVLGHIATVRKEMGVAIAPQAAEYIQLCLEGGEDKIVVFGHHIEVLDVLQAKLHRYGVLRIDGSTSPKRREEYVKLFVTDSRMKVMLGNIQSMGTGVDELQHVATHCVLVEPSWTPGENQQAVDRLDRAGQQGHVQADFIVAPGSIAEKILVSALGKAQTIFKVIG